MSTTRTALKLSVHFPSLIKLYIYLKKNMEELWDANFVIFFSFLFWTTPVVPRWLFCGGDRTQGSKPALHTSPLSHSPRPWNGCFSSELPTQFPWACHTLIFSEYFCLLCFSQTKAQQNLNHSRQMVGDKTPLCQHDQGHEIPSLALTLQPEPGACYCRLFNWVWLQF